MDPSQMQDFPPSYSQSSRKGGYSAMPQGDPYGPPAGYFAPAPPPSAYAPAPSVFQQQSSNTNVVVVGNQPAAQPSVVHVSPPRASEYMFLTAVMMILCFLHGNLPALIICLVPALICSCMAQDHNRAGEYEGAKSCGNAALCCNVFAMVYFVILILAGAAVVAVYFTVGFGAVKDIIDNLPTASPAYNFCCDSDVFTGTCTQHCTKECFSFNNVCYGS